MRFLDNKLGADFGGVIFWHHLSDIDMSYRRYGKLMAHPSPPWETFLLYKDEWRYDTLGGGGGYMSAEAEAVYAPANMRQNIEYVNRRKGTSFMGASDTGYAVTWSQSAAWSPIKESWRLSGDSRWRYTEVYGETSEETFLMSTISEVTSAGSGFSSRQEYRMTRELASRFEQKMFYIGKGLGTHAYDSTFGEFRPSANGDHIIQEVEIYDDASSSSVRKTTLSVDWHFRPQKEIAGILNDLTWSGVLLVDEHVDARNGKAVSYIPGYLSVFGDDRNSNYNDDHSSGDDINRSLYADISYRQDIDYHVKGSIYRSRLYLLPGLRLARGYREGMFETALLAERKKGRLLLSIEPKYISVTREGRHSSGGDLSDNYNDGYDMRDISAEFVQSVELWRRFEAYTRERAGTLVDKGENRITPIPADSSVYFQLTPGIVYRPIKDGIAELYYTFSYVPYNGIIDYRLAAGRNNGITHTVVLHGDIQTGKHFNISCLYRGESAKRLGEDRYAPMTHVFSLTVKAFL